MEHHTAFEVGESYENRKGIYEVLTVEGNAMRIRWDNGEEVDTTVVLQGHIIDGMQLEYGHLGCDKAVSPGRKKVASKGKNRIDP